MGINVGGFEINTTIAQTFHSNEIIQNGLILYLDASSTDSYPGSGTVWYDLSTNNNNFNIVAGAYNSSGPKYMDFNGSYGIAKNSSDFSLSDTNGVTYVLWTRIKNSSATWRTLTRAYAGNHHVIIEAGGWNIGMYDNTIGSGFNGSGYSQQSLPNYGTSNWMCMYFRFKNTSPFYEISYNDTPSTIRASITNSNARHTGGFGSIGGYHVNSTTPSVADQYWGDIANFMCYNRRLTDAELLHNYNVQKDKFGL
jgi:hypothetical protein